MILPEKTNTTINGKVLSAKEIYEHHHNIFNNRFGVIVKLEEVLSILNAKE